MELSVYRRATSDIQYRFLWNRKVSYWHQLYTIDTMTCTFVHLVHLLSLVQPFAMVYFDNIANILQCKEVLPFPFRRISCQAQSVISFQPTTTLVYSFQFFSNALNFFYFCRSFAFLRIHYLFPRMCQLWNYPVSYNKKFNCHALIVCYPSTHLLHNSTVCKYFQTNQS